MSSEQVLERTVRKFAAVSGIPVERKGILQVLADWSNRDRIRYGRDVMIIAQGIGVATDNKDPLTLRDDIIRYVQTLLAERKDMLDRVQEIEMERRDG